MDRKNFVKLKKTLTKKFTSLNSRLLFAGILFLFLGVLLFAVNAVSDGTVGSQVGTKTKQVAKVKSETSVQDQQPAAATQTGATTQTTTQTKKAAKPTAKTATPTPQSPAPSQPTKPTPPNNPPAPFTCNVSDNWIILAPGEEVGIFTFSTSDGSNVSWMPLYKNVIWGDDSTEAPDAPYWMVLDYAPGEHIASEVNFAVLVHPDALPSEHEEVAMFIMDESRDIAMACTFKFVIE